jgi:basic membrane protein A
VPLAVTTEAGNVSPNTDTEIPMKRMIASFIALFILTFLNGCGEPAANAGPDGKSSNPGKSSDSFKVGLVTPGKINDGGWSQGAYDGLKKMEKDLGASVKNTVAGSATEALAAFNDYASQDFNIVIGHASEWFDPKTIAIAKAHPKTSFLISGTEKADGNVVGVRFLLEDSTYVLGQIAASMSKSNVLGCVGPVQIPVIESTFKAFEEGAKSVKKDIKVNVVWTSSWDDIARAKERTLILINNDNADFIFHNANDGAPGVFQGVQEAKGKGKDVFAFGANADQTSMADDVILASGVLDIPSAFLSVGKSVKEGKLKSEAQFLGMKEGFVWVAYNKKLESRIPADVRKLADETVAKIKSGEFKVPRIELK